MSTITPPARPGANSKHRRHVGGDRRGNRRSFSQRVGRSGLMEKYDEFGPTKLMRVTIIRPSGYATGELIAASVRYRRDPRVRTGEILTYRGRQSRS